MHTKRERIIYIYYNMSDHTLQSIALLIKQQTKNNKIKTE